MHEHEVEKIKVFFHATASRLYNLMWVVPPIIN